MELAVDPLRVESVASAIDAFLEDRAPLTGLDLYYLLEKATPLREFHTFLRSGPQNRTRSGLQQSYGDHNRLLLLGLDKLVEGDLDWYRGRLLQPAAVSDDRLSACFRAVRSVDLDRSACIALWLGAALHDCGMLRGSDGNVDVEDGVVLAEGVLEALCPPSTRPLAAFAIRNHDYIRNVFLGEVPSSFIAEQLDELSPDLRTVAISALGMIQVAGAASLGEGRLSDFRVSIFERCFDGSALTDASTRHRVERLLSCGDETTAVPEVDDGVVVRALTAAAEEFLERVPIHGWHRAWSSHTGDQCRAKTVALVTMSSEWRSSGADHVVFSRGSSIPEHLDEFWCPSTSQATLLNGTTALLVTA